MEASWLQGRKFWQLWNKQYRLFKASSEVPTNVFECEQAFVSARCGCYKLSPMLEDATCCRLFWKQSGSSCLHGAMTRKWRMRPFSLVHLTNCGIAHDLRESQLAWFVHDVLRRLKRQARCRGMVFCMKRIRGPAPATTSQAEWSWSGRTDTATCVARPVCSRQVFRPVPHALQCIVSTYCTHRRSRRQSDSKNKSKTDSWN